VPYEGEQRPLAVHPPKASAAKGSSNRRARPRLRVGNSKASLAKDAFPGFHEAAHPSFVNGQLPASDDNQRPRTKETHRRVTPSRALHHAGGVAGQLRRGVNGQGPCAVAERQKAVPGQIIRGNRNGPESFLNRACRDNVQHRREILLRVRGLRRDERQVPQGINGEGSCADRFREIYCDHVLAGAQIHSERGLCAYLYL